MKRYYFLAFFALLSTTSCNSQKKIDKIGYEAVSLFNKGDFKGSLILFEKVIQLDSMNSEAHMRKADCLDNLGDIAGSLKSYTRAIELDKNNKLALYNRALTFEKIGELDKTINDYKSAIICDPNNKSELNNKLILMNLGILYGQMNQLDNAIDAFNRAIEIDNKYTDAYHNRGFAFQLKGDHKKAIENFDKAIELNPNEQAYRNSKQRSELQLKGLN